MPTMANVVVKNATNVDKTFTAIAASSGDKSKAVWQDAASSLVRANRQKAEMEFHDNANGTTRVGVTQISIPYLKIVDGVEVVDGYQTYKLVASQNKRIPDTALTDGSTIALNFFATTLVKSAHAEGMAPRG